MAGWPARRDAISSYLRRQFRKLGGGIEKITYTPDNVRVTWLQPAHAPDPLDPIIHMLQSGDVAAAIVLMRLLLSDDPGNAPILYNLGMALSDRRELDESILYLRRLCDLEPDHVNGRVALGVALMRQGEADQALEQLQEAAELEPANPWAHRNLGACLLALGRVEEGLDHLRQATGLTPTDERSWLGLAQALEQAGDDIGADDAYRQVLAIDEFGDVAEMARQGRSRIAQRSMRSTTPGDVRMDAVFYILGALEKFEGMTPQKVQEIGVEVALLGMKGLDINEPTPKYQLHSLPGKFSGLHLVSIMYAAFQQIAPGQDVGIDLSREYEAAQALRASKPV